MMNLKEQIEEILEDKLLVKIIEKVKKPFIKAILGNESSDIPFGAELEETITDILKVVERWFIIGFMLGIVSCYLVISIIR